MVAVLALATALRLYDLGGTDLWLDEAVTVTLSNWSFGNLLIYPVDPTPGLYYALHKTLVPVDAPAWAVRLLPVAAGLAAIPLMFLLGRTLFGARAGWIAAILLAVWPIHVEYSQDARSYPLLFATTLCVSLGVALYAKAWLGEGAASRRRRVGALALYVLGSVLAVNTHVTALFWVMGGALLLALTAALARRRAAWIEVCVSGLALALLSSTAVYRLVLEVSHEDNFGWLTQASPKDFVITTLQVLFPPGPHGAGLPLSRPLWMAAGGLVAALGVVAARRNRLAITPWALIAGCLMLGYLAVPLAIWLVGFITTPIFMPRTILYAAPGAILMIALVLAKVGPRVGVAATTALALFWGLTAMLAPGPDRENWSATGRTLAAHVKPGDIVILCPAWKYPPLRHALTQRVEAPLLGVDSKDAGLLLLEARLGFNPQWAEAFHKMFEVPWAERQLQRELEDPQRPPPRPAISLAAGSTVWLMISQCEPEQFAQLDATLPASLGPATEVWNDTNRSGEKLLSVFSRRVVTDAEISAAAR